VFGPCPYYSFPHRGWLPCAIAWDPETGRFTRVEGPDGFTTREEAEEASRLVSHGTREKDLELTASLATRRNVWTRGRS
jgi:hypothetical protein